MTDQILYDVIEERITKQSRILSDNHNYDSRIMPIDVCNRIKECQDTKLLQFMAEVFCTKVLNELAYCDDYLDDDTDILKCILNNDSIDKTKLIDIKNDNL